MTAVKKDPFNTKFLETRLVFSKLQSNFSIIKVPLACQNITTSMPVNEFSKFFEMKLSPVRDQLDMNSKPMALQPLSLEPS